jgi:serine/threonine-protein kinase
VLAGLPGGDPLAAALAVGETPSPKLVADAGEVGIIPPRRAALVVGLIAVGLALIAYLNDFSALFRLVPPSEPPDELARKARQLLADVGYPDRPADSECYFLVDSDYLSYVARTDPSPGRWDGLHSGQPAASAFFYRESPEPLAPGLLGDVVGEPGLVTPTNPPPTRPGMATVRLDGQGRLLELIVVPAAPRDAGAVNAPVDWEPLLKKAGLRAGELEEGEFRWVPPTACDRRAAWKGKFPGRPDLALYVEAAAFQGKPVFFRVGGDWTPRDGAVEQPSPVLRLFSAGILAVWAGVALLALRNLRLRRGDRRGAATLAGLIAAGMLAVWLLGGHHPGTGNGEMAGIQSALGRGALMGLVVALAYLAVEPAVRRRWPWRLTGWARVLAGRLRDPLVGRDLLVGLLGGVAVLGLGTATRVVPALLGLPGPAPGFSRFGLPAPRLILLLAPLESAGAALPFFALAFVFTLVLRRDWLGWGGLVVLFTAISVVGTPPSVLGAACVILFVALRSTLFVVVMARFGLLATVAMFAAGELVGMTPLTWDASAWYFWRHLAGGA